MCAFREFFKIGYRGRRFVFLVIGSAERSGDRTILRACYQQQGRALPLKANDRSGWAFHLVLLGLNEPMVVTLSEAKSLGTMGGMLRSAQHDKPLGYFRRDVLAPV